MPAIARATTADSFAKGFSATDDVLKASHFRQWTAYGSFNLMKLRLSLHAVILALFMTAGVLAAYVRPANAGMGRDAVGVEGTMEAGMPCCPSDQDGPKDCATNCPALTFCLAKCFASGTAKTVALPDPVMAVSALMGDDAERASHSFAPPARPPRS